MSPAIKQKVEQYLCACVAYYTLAKFDSQKSERTNGSKAETAELIEKEQYLSFSVR